MIGEYVNICSWKTSMIVAAVFNSTILCSTTHEVSLRSQAVMELLLAQHRTSTLSLTMMGLDWCCMPLRKTEIPL